MSTYTGIIRELLLETSIFVTNLIILKGVKGSLASKAAFEIVYFEIPEDTPDPRKMSESIIISTISRLDTMV